LRIAPVAQVRRSRGFSLVELLVVVVITGILATLGVMLFRKYIGTSKGTEAMAVMQAIRAAEEAYLAENHAYLDVSTQDNRADWFPNKTPNQSRFEWHVPLGGHPDAANWQQLNPVVNRPVQFDFLVYAGNANVAVPQLAIIGAPVVQKPTDDWYVIQAEGDTDGNGRFASYVSTSASNQAAADVWSQNEGE
jgi:prepilin-type N-terminal cleavage/methylation domain-containing protein